MFNFDVKFIFLFLIWKVYLINSSQNLAQSIQELKKIQKTCSQNNQVENQARNQMESQTRSQEKSQATIQVESQAKKM